MIREPTAPNLNNTTRLILSSAWGSMLSPSEVTKWGHQVSPPYQVGSQSGVIKWVLTGAGASRERANSRGCTPLFICCQRGHSAVATLLLEANANPNTPGDDGASPLYVACQNGHIEAARVLLARLPPTAAGLDLPKASGATALYVAAQKGHAAIVEVLLAAGASVDQTTRAGASALFISSLQVKRALTLTRALTRTPACR